MKNLISSGILTLLCLVLFSAIYPMVITGVAFFAPNQGKGGLLRLNGKIRGYQNIGQNFSSEQYFWSRPSAVAYNASGSGGSNKGPSNPEYLKEVQFRTDIFLMHHPYLQIKDIPAELLTASGSGLDPHISLKAALIQVKRIAKARNISEEKLTNFVNDNKERLFLGFIMPQVVNVVKLNLALDSLK